MEQKFKGTPGEWKVTEQVGENRYVETEDGALIAVVADGIYDVSLVNKEVVEANAMLIAAAPKMLEALLLVGRLLDKDDQSIHESELDQVHDVVKDALKSALSGEEHEQ